MDSPEITPGGGPGVGTRPRSLVDFDLDGPVGTEFAAQAARETKRRWFVLGLSLAVIAAAVGGLTLRGPDRAEAQVFAYAFTAGETRTYDLGVSMRFLPKGMPGESPIEGSVKGTMTMTVVEVKPDGSAVVDVSLKVTESSIPQGEMPVEDMSFRATLARDGRVLGVDGSAGFFSLPGAGSLFGEQGGSPTDSGSSQFFFPQFPQEAIAPGDRWNEENEVPMPFGDTKLVVKTSGAHEGFEDTSFGRAARISQRAEIPMDVSLPLGELVSAMMQGFAESFGGVGQPAPTIPPELAAAKMVMQGAMMMDGTALVLPQDGETVSMDADITMDLAVELIGFPAELSQGAPSSFAVEGTMDLLVLRVS